MTTVYLSLGSNKGKREHFLKETLEQLSAHSAIEVTQVSQVYETEPWPKCHSERSEESPLSHDDHKLSYGGDSSPASGVTQNDTREWFLNQVIALRTSLTPERLLKLCQSVEKKVGRLPSEKWGPREIDIDILLYGDQIIHLPDLEVPHPHLNERRFVLVPLVAIAPSLQDPVSGKAYKIILQSLKDAFQVKPYLG